MTETNKLTTVYFNRPFQGDKIVTHIEGELKGMNDVGVTLEAGEIQFLVPWAMLHYMKTYPAHLSGAEEDDDY